MKHRILIVDDEAGVRSALAGVLEDEGHDRRGGGERRGLPRARASPAIRPRRARRLAAGHRRSDHAGTAARARPRRRGGRHLGPRQHRVGRPRDQDGRLRLRREAAVAREDGARGPQRPAPAPARGREPRPARAGGPRPGDGRRERADAAAARADRDGRADQRPGPHLRRERYRQGARRPQRSRAEPSPWRSLRRGQLRGDSRGADRERAVRPRPRRVHRRGRRSPRPLRGGRWRHAVPRRDRAT